MNAGNSINLAVPEDQQGAVAGWQDGETYAIKVKQTAPGQLELVSAESDDDDSATNDAGTPAGGGSDNPAMDAVIAAKQGK